MRQVLSRAKSKSARRSRGSAAGSRDEAMRKSEPEPGQKPAVRQRALYCTPHMKIPGVISASPTLLTFEPDGRNSHVQEVGVEQYTVALEVEDLFECGAVAMPLGDATSDSRKLGFFLQLQVRTLDGETFWSSEDADEPWFVVFRLKEREHLYEVATLLLDAIEEYRKAPPSSAGRRCSRTSVPFPCLDCMAELEHVAHHKQLERQLSQEQEKAPPAPGAPARLIGNLAAFLTGPSQTPATSPKGSAETAPNDSEVSSPCRLEKVTLRLPENCERSLLTKELAEALLDYLPVAVRLPGLVEWVLRYTPKAHGVSLATLFRNLSEREKTVVLIQDTEDYVFGGFATAAWEPCFRFFGSGEAFVFTFGLVQSTTEPPEKVQFFPWTSENECFMYADHDLIGMGGGDGKHAFVIKEDLLTGHSAPTLTYKNSILSAREEFVVRDIEVWSLEEVQ